MLQPNPDLDPANRLAMPGFQQAFGIIKMVEIVVVGMLADIGHHDGAVADLACGPSRAFHVAPHIQNGRGAGQHGFRIAEPGCGFRLARLQNAVHGVDEHPQPVPDRQSLCRAPQHAGVQVGIDEARHQQPVRQAAIGFRMMLPDIGERSDLDDPVAIDRDRAPSITALSAFMVTTKSAERM